MLFRIAEVIGCTVGELENKISYSEFLTWIEYLMIKDGRKEMHNENKTTNAKNFGVILKSFLGNK